MDILKNEIEYQGLWHGWRVSCDACGSISESGFLGFEDESM